MMPPLISRYKRAGCGLNCRPFNDIGCFVSLQENLRTHGPVVDADVVDQAGEVGSGCHELAGAEVQAAI